MNINFKTALRKCPECNSLLMPYAVRRRMGPNIYYRVNNIRNSGG